MATEMEASMRTRSKKTDDAAGVAEAILIGTVDRSPGQRWGDTR